jgi:hypothetical protein
MPPSAGACQTTDAALNPDCGRAARRSSIMTAIGRRAATSGGTNRPVKGAGMRTGVGLGVGVGVGLGVGLCSAVGVEPAGASGSLDPAATGTPPLAVGDPGDVPAASTPSAIAPTRASMATPARTGRLIVRTLAALPFVNQLSIAPRTSRGAGRRIQDVADQRGVGWGDTRGPGYISSPRPA